MVTPEGSGSCAMVVPVNWAIWPAPGRTVGELAGLKAGAMPRKAARVVLTAPQPVSVSGSVAGPSMLLMYVTESPSST